MGEIIINIAEMIDDGAAATDVTFEGADGADGATCAVFVDAVAAPGIIFEVAMVETGC